MKIGRANAVEALGDVSGAGKDRIESCMAEVIISCERVPKAQ